MPHFEEAKKAADEMRQEARLCTDCKWHKSGWMELSHYATCQRPGQRVRIDMVSGEPFEHYCSTERLFDTTEESTCGIQGQYFEKKELPADQQSIDWWTTYHAWSYFKYLDAADSNWDGDAANLAHKEYLELKKTYQSAWKAPFMPFERPEVVCAMPIVKPKERK